MVWIVSSTVAGPPDLAGTSSNFSLRSVSRFAASPVFQLSASTQRGAMAFTFTDTKSPMPEGKSGFFMPVHTAETGQPGSAARTVGLAGDGGDSGAAAVRRGKR